MRTAHDLEAPRSTWLSQDDEVGEGCGTVIHFMDDLQIKRGLGELYHGRLEIAGLFPLGEASAHSDSSAPLRPHRPLRAARILFGAAALAGMRQEKADAVLEQLLIEAGINHIDTAASYGEAELRIGPWMREHRDRSSSSPPRPATERAKAAARWRASTVRSNGMRVDSVDHHPIAQPGRPSDDWHDRELARDGAA